MVQFRQLCDHRQIWNAVNRRKTITENFNETPLRRCLTTVDMTLLGIGQMVGAGIFVLTGTVMRDLAGPATFISFLLAGLAAMLSALCYAEFGARVPKAGSAYVYTYLTIGELWGFIIGWNIVLEGMIGASSLARAFSGSLDALFGGAIRNGTIAHIGRLSNNSEWVSEYPDFIAFATCCLVFAVAAIGVKATTRFNNVFTVINMFIICFLIVACFSFADVDNFKNTGHGGFLPFGFGGVLSGAATSFFAYIGFECIAVSGEESQKPEKSIPLSIIISMSIVTFIYVIVTLALGLMVPYDLVDENAAFPIAFERLGLHWIKFIVAAGTLVAISSSLIGSSFGLPRAIYAMASDGLLFEVLSRVHPKTQTPIYAIAVFGFLSAVLAFIFEIKTLVEFMSIGTLVAYTIVAGCVIILRYSPVDKCQFKLKPEKGYEVDQASLSEESQIMNKTKSYDDFGKLRERLKTVPLLHKLSPGSAVSWAVVLMGISMMCFCATVEYGIHHLQNGRWWIILLVIIFSVVIIAFYLVIIAHEQNDAFLTFQMPFVPLLPSLSIFVNIALMLKLSYLTWIRLAIWLAIGLILYFGYGLKHSKERQPVGEYGEIVEYTGEASIGSVSSLTKLEETVHHQQPH